MCSCSGGIPLMQHDICVIHHAGGADTYWQHQGESTWYTVQVLFVWRLTARWNQLSKHVRLTIATWLTVLAGVVAVVGGSLSIDCRKAPCAGPIIGLVGIVLGFLFASAGIWIAA